MIATWSQGPADANMPEAFLADTLEKVRRHPWWIARAKLARAILEKHGVRPPQTVADAGCGWGTNLDALEKSGYQVTGFDISRRILEMIDQPARTLVELDFNQPLPADHARFDSLLALDVIEHIDDDRAAVAGMARLLKPGGTAIVSVPALPELFSEFDAIQGHRRRYLPETLRAAFANTGLEVREIFWWGSWMVPILRRSRNRVAGSPRPAKTYSDYLKLPPWPVPWLMSLAYAREHSPAVRGTLKTGTSLFAVATRQG
jgi:SAM-dependent methyltransferase